MPGTQTYTYQHRHRGQHENAAHHGGQRQIDRIGLVHEKLHGCIDQQRQAQHGDHTGHGGQGD